MNRIPVNPVKNPIKLIRTHYPYLIGTDLPLEKNDVDHLVRLFEKKPDLVTEILNGRNAVVRDKLCGNIPVVIKTYRRGGMIRHVMRDAYFRRSGPPRSSSEYAMLKRAISLGVSCPEPLVWAIRGGLFYKAFLVTREIENQRSLVDLCQNARELCAFALHKTAEQVARLIENHIHHVDLHPGNVLMDEKKNIYIIDFDKAHESRLSMQKLTDAVIKRWKRAVVKYNLPDLMADIFERDLIAFLNK